MGGAIPAGGGSGGGFPLAGLPLAVGRHPTAQRGRDQTRRGPADHDDNRLAYGGATLAESHLAEGSAGCDSGRAVLLVGRRHRGRLPLLRGSPLR